MVVTSVAQLDVNVTSRPFCLDSTANVLRSSRRISARSTGLRAIAHKALVHRQTYNIGSVASESAQSVISQKKSSSADRAQAQVPIVEAIFEQSQHSSHVPQLVTAGRRTMLGMGAMASCSCCHEAMAAPTRPKPAAAWSYGQQDRPAAWKGMCAVGAASTCSTLAACTDIHTIP